MDDITAKRWSNRLTCVAALLLLLSFFLPAAATTNKPDDRIPGYLVLAIGWLGLLIGQVGWLGNLALPIALVSGWNWPRYVTAIAFVSSLAWKQMHTDNGSYAITWLIGYYVWMAAMFAVSVPLIFGSSPVQPSRAGE